LLLVPVGLNNAFAATIEITDEASCLAAGAGTFFVAPNADGCFFNSLTVDAGDTLIVENVFLSLGAVGLTNFGNIIMVGGSEQGSGVILPSQGGALVNECGATITLEGSDGISSGLLGFLIDGESFTNFGTLNLNGGDGQRSGSLAIANGGIANNHGTINENPGSGSDSGVVFVFGTAVFNDNLPNNCPSEIIGGEFLPIETTSLLLAAASSPAAWLTSLTIAALGIGAYVFTRNPNNIRNIKVILRDYLDRL